MSWSNFIYNFQQRKIRRKNPNVRPDTDCQDPTMCQWHCSWAPRWSFLTARSPHPTGECVHVSEGGGESFPHHSLWHVVHATELWQSRIPAREHQTAFVANP